MESIDDLLVYLRMMSPRLIAATAYVLAGGLLLVHPGSPLRQSAERHPILCVIAFFALGVLLAERLG
ncbi:hypothetical protein [Zoogloea sp.]|uniref:hypothetical protein n=1 Tax=Zoogloea sp. TaxID=49181 RepID=UPI001415D776|nr:MAG: hypothetical protein F9K15_03145 [Zoogloea sp.]